MTTIYLIRHAEAEGNLHRRIHGWYDALVTDNGFRQIAALQGRFQKIPVDAVYSSDLYRTMTTARAVYLPKGLPLRTDPRLREVNMGDWEDKPWGEVYRNEPAEIARFNRSDPTWRAPHGDSLGELGDRVEEAITDIAASHPDQTAAVFCHGTAIRQFLANVKGIAPEDWHTMPHFDNTAVTCLTYDGQSFSIRFEGDASHLPRELSTLGRQAWWRKEPGKRDINLWHRPIRWPEEEPLLLRAWQETWAALPGPHPPETEALRRAALDRLEQSPWGLTISLDGDTPAGLLQLDPRRDREAGVGYIDLLCVLPEMGKKGLGIQLIGQAVAFYRPLGRDRLRLTCSPQAPEAGRFFRRYGFSKIGEDRAGPVPLDLLEKYIGYHQ